MQSLADASSPLGPHAITNPSNIKKKLCNGRSDICPSSSLFDRNPWTCCKCQTLNRNVWQCMRCQHEFCSRGASDVDEIPSARKKKLCDDGSYDSYTTSPLSPSDGNLWICCRCITMNRDRTECR